MRYPSSNPKILNRYQCHNSENGIKKYQAIKIHRTTYLSQRYRNGRLNCDSDHVTFEGKTSVKIVSNLDWAVLLSVDLPFSGSRHSVHTLWNNELVAKCKLHMQDSLVNYCSKRESLL